MVMKCQICKERRADYNFKHHPARFCGTHKKEGMVTNPNSYCEHERRKDRCKECGYGGRSLCDEKRRTGMCSKCFREKELVKRLSFCQDCKNDYERKRLAGQSQEKKEELLAKQRERFHRSKEENLQKTVTKMQDETFLATLKKCTVCGQTKEVREFHVAKGKGTVRAACRDCTSAKRKEYYKNNAVAVTKQTTQYKVEKMKTNPTFKLEVRLRSRISCALKAQGEEKTQRTRKYLDCTSSFFQEWIKFQLYDGMTLENYGTLWHVDHVKPCASFDLSNEAEVAECFSWKNLRPLLKHKNSEKGAKVDIRELVLQELKVKCFTRKPKVRKATGSRQTKALS